MRKCLLLLLALVGCSHGPPAIPHPSACEIDALSGRFDTLASLTGTFSVRIDPHSGPKEFGKYKVALHLGPNDNAEIPLAGLADISPHPFPGIDLFVAPVNEKTKVWYPAKEAPALVVLGGNWDGPVLAFEATTFGSQGFTGRWWLRWWDYEGRGKQGRAWGDFCALRTS
jgi:hypothetical protein